MKDKLLVIGAGGHGKVIADIALQMNKWKEINFLDRDSSVSTAMGLKVIGHPDAAKDYIKEYDLFVGIGDNVTRKIVQEKLEIIGATIPILVHPSAVIGSKVKMKSGTVVMAGAIVNCCTKVGSGCIINTGASIDHDNILEDFVHISPGVRTAGSVRIGEASWLGIGSIVSNNVKITQSCIIGAGAIVVNEIKDSGTYVGIPAKRLLKSKKNIEE